MLCPVCGLDNDPSAVLCARCNTSLALGNPPPPANYGPQHPSMQYSSMQQQPMGPPETPPTIHQMAVPSSPNPAPVPWRLILIAAVLVLLVGIAGSVVIVVLTGKPKTTPVAQTGASTATTAAAAPATSAAGPGPTTKVAASSPKEQAAVLNKLLDRSVASRTKLNKAIDKVNNCTDLPQALADMQRVGVERTKEIADADAADVTGLANGEKIRSTLKSALGFALEADQHFVAWAQPTIAGGCADTAARQAAFASAQASSQQAQAAKQKLVDLWNPVATRLGFKERSTQFI